MGRLNLLIDARKLGDGGIGLYIENLLTGLIADRESGIDVTVRAIVSNNPTKAVSNFLQKWGTALTVIEDRSPKYSVDELFFLPRRLKSAFAESDIFHSPHYTLPFGVRIPSLVTVHDLIHVLAPESLAQRFIGGALLRSSMRRASRVITVSSVSLSRLSRFVPGVPILVIQNALSPDFGLRPFSEVYEVLERLAVPRPYVLFVGSDRPHKGFTELAQAMSLIKDFRKALVVVGSRFSDMTKWSTTAALGEQFVRFVGEVSREDLVKLYNGARVVVVPSKMEGFGLVALEALGSGVPLVCSPEQSLREIAEDSAWYADGADAGSLSRAIWSCVSYTELASEKVRKGLQRAAHFHLRQFIYQHWQAYLGLLPETQSIELSQEIGALYRPERSAKQINVEAS